MKLCFCFESRLCCKYRTRIRDAQMAAELESGFDDWLCVMFQMPLLKLPKPAPVCGSLPLILILDDLPSAVNLHHVVPKLRSIAESSEATNCRSSHSGGRASVLRCSLSRNRMEMSIKKWEFFIQNNKKLGSKNGQRISSVGGGSEPLVSTRWHLPRETG